VIDTHCHLLPAIDDGPSTTQEAVELGRRLAEAGADLVVCTPHFSRRFPTDHATALERVTTLETALAESQVRLRCMLAAELTPAAALDSTPAELEDRRLGRRHLLVELEASTPVGAVDLTLARLDELGLIPVFAHPERCRAMRSNARILDGARAAGALVQVVAPSLAGRGGGSAERFAWDLLADGRADLVASDAHRPEHAGESLSQVLALIAKRFGQAAVDELTHAAPARIIDRSG
jgi:protein-tyrosine phosphatase